jgi:hypothetical protein
VFNAGMLPRSRSIVVAGAVVALLGSLALAGSASARIIEIGDVEPAIESTCPGTPCVAVSRTTGYQAQVVKRKRSFLVPADGRIVAWTIGLGDPNPDQMGYFDQRFGEASASLTIMRRNKFRRKRLIHRVVGRSPVQRLTPYFGQSVQFPLATSLPVKKGFVVALTVPTWAPALTALTSDGSLWRASRAEGRCKNTSTQTAQTDIGDRVKYGCKYPARLNYSATLITSPTPTADPGD